MKKTLLLVGVVMLCMFSIASAQVFSDFVSAMRGDTAVIKDYTEKGSTASTLTTAVGLDAAAPAGRVYMLKANGYYPLASNLTTPSARPVVIVGSDFTRIAKGSAASAPPLICGSTIQGAGSNTGGITWQNNLTVKNCNILPAASDGTLGWAFFGDGAAGKRVILENCLFERTRWVIINSNNSAGTSLFISDCYFVNLTGQACRRNGGVYDNVNNDTDTMWVENTTHVMTEGMMYKFRNFPTKKVVFNHNTFVNCAGQLFETLGYQSNMVITNNVFVNSNIQPYDTSLGTADVGEVDADNQPMGIVNVRALPASMPQLARKVLVDNNVIYWDAKLNDIVSIANSRRINGSAAWQSQAITMNTRTQGLFNNNTTYPYLTEGRWYRKMPAFVNAQNLSGTALDSLKAFALGTVDVNSTNILPAWRINSLGAANYVYSDWPIPVDLSYTDADLMAGGTGGFPVGDLNWFPARKTAWSAQRATEYTNIDAALNAGRTTAVSNAGTVPVEFALNQNYPNPFNPSTTISFSLPNSAYASLKVFDMLGREVATLVNGYTTSGTHNVQFDATNVSSGVYFYKLTSGDFTQMKKMTLVK